MHVWDVARHETEDAPNHHIMQFVLLRNVGCMVGCKLGHPVLNVGIALGLLYLYCMNEYNLLRSTAVN